MHHQGESVEVNKEKAALWDYVKAFCAIAITAVFAVKIYLTPISLTVDFPTLLSLLLALFSVALAAMFYFKATETSNTFYDNTYKFTRDIAQLLVKIESGFGERLRHLDEGYSSMRSYIQNLPGKSNEDVEKTKRKIETEQQEVEKVVAERNEIIRHLVERSQLHEEEKETVLHQLKAKEEEVLEAQKEVEKLNKHLLLERLKRRRDARERMVLDDGLANFTLRHVVRKIGSEQIRNGSDSFLRRNFGRLVNDLPGGYIEDLEKHGYFESGLTPSGVRYLRAVASSEGNDA
ncbi:hypothetical protein [Solimonas marina]|uniref:Uncharacterized protein n=1 Tax=Solimonas marina TaxID=2714601 RepID=A0A970B7X9_9GAMM|nr:hypothetical protein [Solimonas marina]NKF20871.1 hypothetical protein [Solimonas marina]